MVCLSATTAAILLWLAAAVGSEYLLIG
jgi:hypothetical protein